MRVRGFSEAASEEVNRFVCPIRWSFGNVLVQSKDF